MGSCIVKSLVEQYRIIVIEANAAKLFRLEEVRDKLHVFDVKNVCLEEIFQNHKIDIVLHLATVYSVTDNSTEQLLNTNLLLPIRLLELCERYDIKYFINTDTFFNSPKFSNYEYLDAYTLSKRHVIDWLKTIAKSTKVINMKIFHMYGPNDSPNKFVSMIFKKLKGNESCIDLTLGEQIRDFIYIDDVVSAYTTVVSNIQKIEKTFVEYEVGTSTPTSIKEFVTSAAEITNSGSKLNFGSLPYRKGEVMEIVADNKQLISIGWRPRTGISQGIKSIFDSMQNISHY